MNATARTRSFVAVVNEALARRLFPTLEPSAVVGQPVRLFGTTGPTNEIVGVAANIRSRRPDMPPDPESMCRSSRTRRRA